MNDVRFFCEHYQILQNRQAARIAKDKRNLKCRPNQSFARLTTATEFSNLEFNDAEGDPRKEVKSQI